MKAAHVREIVSEGLGTAFLLAAIVGSGIMAERLAGGNTALALLANSLATGAALAALLLTFGPVSGAHFNPVVTLCEACLGGVKWARVPGYLSAQFFGALAGTALANRMFDLPFFFASTRARGGSGQLLGECVATFGLLAVIRGCSRHRPHSLPFAVAAYIMAAYWFTASTSFANPAVTLARAASNTFAGIRIFDAPAFMSAQLAGAAAATLLFKWLAPIPRKTASGMPATHPGST